MNVEIGTEAAQFLFWDYINSNFFAVYTYQTLQRRRIVSRDSPTADSNPLLVDESLIDCTGSIMNPLRAVLKEK
jgi:hypothetical protein